MAIEFNRSMKILTGVVLLAAAGGAAAWFYLDDITSMFAEPPKKVAVAKPAAAAKADAAKPADAAKTADAVKPAAEATKVAEAPKAAEPAKAGEPGKAAEPVKTAEAPKAAADAKPALKPIPTNPDRLVAEVIETSGLKAYFQTFGREAMLSAGAGERGRQSGLSPAELHGMLEAVERVFEPTKMQAELAANLKEGLDVERMSRFLEILRQPISLKMTSAEMRTVTPEAMKEYSEKFRTTPPSAERMKLIQALDEVTKTSEVGAEMATTLARDMIDAMFDSMQKAGKNVPREARQMLGSQLNSMRNQARSQVRTVMYIMYSKATDQELMDYIKVLDTDNGRWGMETLANAMRPVLVSRGSAFGREVAQVALGKLQGKMAKAKMTEESAAPLAKSADEGTAAPETAKPAPAAAAEPPAYKRAANTRELYSRYNDLITATVMRDSAAVKELLADGKYPDVRQKDGFTPLMIAASNGDVETASLLLGRGADPNLRAAGGKSALWLARQRNAAAMVQLLQSKGARE